MTFDKVIRKLTEVTIKGIKNVDNGTILLKEKNGNYLNLTGVYGQNGSGKTTLIDAMEIVKLLLLNQPIDNNVVDSLSVDKVAEITVSYDIVGHRMITYAVKLKRDGHRVAIVGEKLMTKTYTAHSHIRTLIAYDAMDKKIVDTKNKFSINQLDLEVAKKSALLHSQSFIFGTDFFERIKAKSDNKAYQEVFEVMAQFQAAALDIVIHTDKFNGLLAAGIMLPLTFAVQLNNRQTSGTIGIDIASHHNDDNLYYDEEAKNIIEEVIAQISTVLNQIVPGVTLSTETHPRMKSDGNGQEFRIELISNRDERHFPFRVESSGVQKLVSVLGVIISAFNNENKVVLIDEFDAGIYEYMLGDLIKILAEGVRGQIVFTSHNLHILEMLDAKNIYFSTNDSQNRYTKITNVKASNNLRSMYLREIVVGEKYYQETNRTDIKNALRGVDETHDGETITEHGKLRDF
ncbi:MAG: AAA family ATPase [Lactobacillaceae bacterium]|jgi:AAA15 family ATPase/GTPase|nr:AAA family ATPase [Lactobacillaceae bacterium]